MLRIRRRRWTVHVVPNGPLLDYPQAFGKPSSN